LIRLRLLSPVNPKQMPKNAIVPRSVPYYGQTVTRTALACPFGRGICCDVDSDEVSAVEPDDDEGIKLVETDSWNNKQVHGGNVWRVVTQEGPPSLGGWPPPLDLYLATLDCATSNPSLSSSP
jgi:hypothetical protein